jgi:hypothetical protein
VTGELELSTCIEGGHGPGYRDLRDEVAGVARFGFVKHSIAATGVGKS